MRCLLSRSALVVTLFAVSACTQPAAQVELKGQNTYARGGVSESNYRSSVSYRSSSSDSSYAAPVANVSQKTEQMAPAGSIGVNDLAPPAKNDQGSSNSTVSTTTLADAKPVAEQHILKEPTKKSSQQQSSQQKPVAQKTLVQAPAHVNPWTQKPRGEEVKNDTFGLQPQGKSLNKQLISEIQGKQATQVASLDKAVETADKPQSALAAKQDAKGFIWPVNGKKVLSSYGPKGAGKANDGINIASAEGEPVWASAGGEVVYAANGLKGYGNMVLIKHAGGKTTTYAHLSRTAVEKYARVKQGDIIGYVGSSGNVKEPQLHFAIREGKEPVDPAKYLNRDVAGL